MHVIYIISSVQALIFAFLASGKKKQQFADKVFVAIMLTLAVQLAFAFFTATYPAFFKPFLMLDAGTMVLYPIIIFYYVQVIVKDIKSFTLKDMVHIMPVLVLYIIILPFRGDSIQSKQFHLPLFLALSWGFICNIYYIYQIFALLKKHKLNIKHLFSFSKHVDLKWIRHFLVGYILVFLATLVLSAFFNTAQIDVENANQIIYYLLSIFVFYIGYNGYKQGAFLPDFSKNTISHEERIVIHKSKEEIFLQELNQYMHVHKPYLNPKLTINQLASQLHVPPYYLSGIINTKLKCNFFEFVNNFRTEEFKQKLKNKSNENFTLVALALESGFNSKASFYRIFKEKTGVTPSQYAKKQ